jgi:hypothetical protein
MAEDPTPSGNPDAEERPDWLPENFNSPEDLVKSYQEAQRKITEETSARKALEQNFSSLSEQVEALQQQSQQPQVDPYAQQQQLAEAYETDPIGTMAWLAQQSAQQAVQQYAQTAQQQFQPTIEAQMQNNARFAGSEMQAKYDDYDHYFPKIQEAIMQDPDLLPETALQSVATTQAKLERIYKMVKADDVIAGTVPQQSQADLMRTMKLNAQSADGAGGRPGSPDAGEQRWKEIQNAPVVNYRDLFSA